MYLQTPPCSAACLSHGQAAGLSSALPDMLCGSSHLSVSGYQFPRIDTENTVPIPPCPCNVGWQGTEEGPDLAWYPLAQNQLDTQRPLVTESVKRAVVSTARDSWEVYFSRLFPATVRAPANPQLTQGLQ